MLCFCAILYIGGENILFLFFSFLQNKIEIYIAITLKEILLYTYIAMDAKHIYTECVDTRGLEYLYQMPLIMFAEYYDGYKKDLHGEFKKTYNFASTMIRQKANQMAIPYKYAGAKTYGRLYAKGGLQSLQKHFRGLLCRTLTTDIDLVNAHPRILEFVCKKHEIACPNLTYYNANRNAVLQTVMESDDIDKGKAKEKFLIATNNNKKLYGTKCSLLKDYDKEMKRIQCELLLVDEYARMVDDAKRTNLAGSSINLILCKYENEILQHMVEFLSGRSIEICTLMFDGVMVYGNLYEDHQLLRDVESFLKDKWDFDFLLDYKEHSTLIQVPTDFEAKPLAPDYEVFKHKFEETHLKVGGVYVKETLD